VATRVGGIPEVVEDQVTGVLAEAGDAEGLARAVEGLIRDTERRAAMGQAGREAAGRRFSAEVIVGEYERLYRRVVG